MEKLFANSSGLIFTKNLLSIKVFGLLLLLILGSCVPMGNNMKAPDKSIYEPRKAEFREQVYKRQTEFDIMDKNRDGYLSLTEYNGTEKLFKDMDLDADERLSKSETKYMITFAEIPEGTFAMGSIEPLQAFFEPTADCTPEHQVKLDAFKMSATEITNTQYVKFLNSALKVGEIIVRNDAVSNAMTRVHYPVSAWAVFGPKGSKYEGKPYIHLSPIAPLSHHKMENGLLLPEHPLNISWIDYLPESNKFVVHPGFEDWPASHIKW